MTKSDSGYTASFQRPLKATLFVRLENGEEWEATPKDLQKFRLVPWGEAYMRIDNFLSQALSLDTERPSPDRRIDKALTDSPLNPFRYACEVLLNYYELHEIEHNPEFFNEQYTDIVQLLQDARRGAAVRQEEKVAALHGTTPKEF